MTYPKLDQGRLVSVPILFALKFCLLSTWILLCRSTSDIHSHYPNQSLNVLSLRGHFYKSLLLEMNRLRDWPLASQVTWAWRAHALPLSVSCFLPCNVCGRPFAVLRGLCGLAWVSLLGLLWQGPTNEVAHKREISHFSKQQVRDESVHKVGSSCGMWGRICPTPLPHLLGFRGGLWCSWAPAASPRSLPSSLHLHAAFSLCAHLFIRTLVWWAGGSPYSSVASC